MTGRQIKVYLPVPDLIPEDLAQALIDFIFDFGDPREFAARVDAVQQTLAMVRTRMGLEEPSDAALLYATQETGA